MRRAFQEVYELLDQGLHLDEVARRVPSRALSAAQEHLQRSLAFDRDAFAGVSLVAGIDEVGRGPLAGPLVAVCLLLSPTPPPWPFLRDSKKLSSAERQALAPRLAEAALRLGYGVVEPNEFELSSNLHQLTFVAMRRAVQAAGLPPDGALLIDGKYPLPGWPGLQRAVIRGDDTSLRIAAASVLAKVYRDQRMLEAEALYPQYGFARHVGYGTAAHREALERYGPCPLHRPSFVRRWLDPVPDSTPVQLSLDLDSKRHSLSGKRNARP